MCQHVCQLSYRQTLPTLVNDRMVAFGELLERWLDRSGMTKIALCRALGVSRPYLYSVLSGDVPPPVPDKQLLIAQILDLDSTDAAELFDTAARERREIPADIARYYLIDERHRCEFRMERAEELEATWKNAGPR